MIGQGGPRTSPQLGPIFSCTLHLTLIGVKNNLYMNDLSGVCHNLFHGGLFTFLSYHFLLRLKLKLKLT